MLHFSDVLPGGFEVADVLSDIEDTAIKNACRQALRTYLSAPATVEEHRLSSGWIQDGMKKMTQTRRAAGNKYTTTVSDVEIHDQTIHDGYCRFCAGLSTH